MQKNTRVRIYQLSAILAVIVSAIGIYFYISNPLNDKLFAKVAPSTSGINFVNEITYNNSFNSYTYNNFYSGGGAAIGDINNDGRPDIFLSANQKRNRLYLNKGDFTFEDITEQAGVGGTKPWSTGVSMADVNGDGWLDIYVCNSGLFRGSERSNELFINNGDPTGDGQVPTFTEQAEKYGLDDSGFSTQATFFDYDRDGDLDLYLLNYSSRSTNSFNQQNNLRHVKDLQGGDRLYRNNLVPSPGDSSMGRSDAENNDRSTFTDVTDRAGIYSSAIGFGLGATVGDVNRDGWMDIYISNDFFERDYLYINNRDGTFREALEQQMNSISTTSMSGDIADLDNDGYPEIFITDMLPEKELRIKTITDFIGWDRFQAEIANGYFRKFERNTLQYNNGNGTFSEIGRYSGVEATDWSWGGLIADFNLDGSRDIFVPNGIYKDMTDKDALMTMMNDKNKRSFIKNGQIDYEKIVRMTPSNPLSNYMFENRGDLRFIDRAADWGLNERSFSNGAAYGDLDGDGDPDLVVNNVNMKPFIYRNRSAELHPDRAWIKIVLKGEPPNRYGVGAQVELKANGRRWYTEQVLQRGFQSSIDPTLMIGLGTGISLIDTVKVIWPDGRVSLQAGVEARQQITVKQSDSNPSIMAETPSDVAARLDLKDKKDPILADITDTIAPHWTHRESSYNDFKRSPMLFHMRSTEGPPLCTGDINNDGLEDFYVGGAARQPGALFLQKKSTGFTETEQPLLESDRNAEDTGCLFFDADGDARPELYVASGSDEYPVGSENYADRVYKFDENGQLFRLPDALPEPRGGFQPTGVVRSSDIDGDGDLDLFVGVRMNPTSYGLPVGGYLLVNDGTGRFKDGTDRLAPGLGEGKLHSAGITDAGFGDLDGDGTPDLAVAGEWMPLTIFFNRNGHLQPADPKDTGLDHTGGWWQSLALADLDGDGALDIVGGNHGLNSRFRASPEKPVQMWAGDFDQNGISEQIFARYTEEGGPYPLALLQNMVHQLPYLRSSYPTFSSYANATVDEIFEREQLDQAHHYRVEQLASVVAWNNGDGRFQVHPLPFSAQLAPIYSILADNLDNDGKPELIMGGNLSSARPQAGSYMAGYGTILKAGPARNLVEIPHTESGFFCRGEIRAIRSLSSPGGKLVVVARNNEPIKIFSTAADR